MFPEDAGCLEQDSFEEGLKVFPAASSWFNPKAELYCEGSSLDHVHWVNFPFPWGKSSEL